MCAPGGTPTQTLLGSTNINQGGSMGPIMSTPVTTPMPLPEVSIPQSDSAARLALVTQGLGSVTSAVGAFSKANADRMAAQNNVRIANDQAANAVRMGDIQAQKLYQQTSQLKGTQRATLGASGVDLGSGSPLDILTSTDVMAKTDQDTLKTNTQLDVNAAMNKAAYYRSQASNASPFVSAASSLVTGAGAVAGKWYDFKKAGNFSSGFFGG